MNQIEVLKISNCVRSSVSKKEKFELMYKEYQSMVFRMSMAYVKGDSALAQDLTQDVFVNIWNALAKFKGDSSAKTWVYRITVNTCLKYMRDRKDKAHLAIDDVDQGELPESSQNATDELERVHQHLYHALGRLKKIDRLIMVMVLDQQEYKDISRAIGISEVNLRVRIHRIKTRLKRMMENE